MSNRKASTAKAHARSDRHEPTPLETLQYIAQAIVDAYDETPVGTPSSFGNSITLGEVRERVARMMAAKDEYFTSDYRHGITLEHEALETIMGGGPRMNFMIEDIKAGKRAGVAEVR